VETELTDLTNSPVIIDRFDGEVLTYSVTNSISIELVGFEVLLSI